MKWSSLLARIKSQYRTYFRSTDLDAKLIRSLRQRSWPQITQLKYLGKFLSASEIRVVKIALTTGLIFGFLTVGSILLPHIGTAPKNGGTYTEALVGQPRYVNPIFSSTSEVDADISSLIFSGLFRYQNGKLITDLATDYEISADKKNYTVKLRPNIVWSDGEKFSAADVIFTVDTIQDPLLNSPLASAFQGVTAERVNDLTIKFALTEPFAPFLNALTVGIIPEHIWSEIPPAGMRLSKFNLQPIGTGPWQFEKMVKDDVGNIQSYYLAPNPHYYQKNPFLKNLSFLFFDNYDLATQSFLNQKVDAISFLPNTLKDKLPAKTINNYALHLPQTTALFFNQLQSTVLKDPKIRQALLLSLDKKQILHVALKDQGELINAPIFPENFIPTLTDIKFDPESAQKLLDQNWPRRQPEEYFNKQKEDLLKSRQNELTMLQASASSSPSSTEKIQQITFEAETQARSAMKPDQQYYRQNKDKQFLTITITTVDLPEYARAAETIASFWRAVGVTTDIKIIPPRQINREIIKGRNFEVLLYGELAGFDPDPYPFWHSSQVDYPGLNLAQYVNREADKLLEEARTNANAADRSARYQKFAALLQTDLPAIFLYSPLYNFVVNKNVQGIEVGRIVSPSDRYAGSVNWYAKTKLTWK